MSTTFPQYTPTTWSGNSSTAQTWYGYPYGQTYQPITYPNPQPNNYGYNQWSNNNYSYTVNNPNRITFTIGGIAFCISNFDYIVGTSSDPINNFLIDYRRLGPEQLKSISNELMQCVLLYNMNMPTLLFLAVYTLVNHKQEEFELIKLAIQQIHMAASCGPCAFRFDREGEIIRMAVEAAMSLEALSETE